MNKLHIDLANCYGIRQLKADLDFAQHKAFAIYAPNGVMKSSLAHTFKDIADGVPSKDVIFPARTTIRTVTDEKGTAVTKDEVLAVAPYDAFYYPHLWPGACLNMALDTPGFV